MDLVSHQYYRLNIKELKYITNRVYFIQEYISHSQRYRNHNSSSVGNQAIRRQFETVIPCSHMNIQFNFSLLFYYVQVLNFQFVTIYPNIK